MDRIKYISFVQGVWPVPKEFTDYLDEWYYSLVQFINFYIVQILIIWLSFFIFEHITKQKSIDLCGGASILTFEEVWLMYNEDTCH